MAYTPLSDAELSQDQPLTQPKAFAFRDNPIAIGNAEAGAPYAENVWHPYDGVTVGDGNKGLIYDFATDGSVSSIVSPDWEDGYNYSFFTNGLFPDVTNDFELEVYKETDANYSTALNLITSVTPTSTLTGYLEFDHPRLILNRHKYYGAFDIGIGSAASDLEAAQIYDGTAQKILRARFAFGPRDIDGGQMYMFRKRDLLVL